MNDLKLSPTEVDYILSPEAIRASTTKIYNYVQSGKSAFVIHINKLDELTSYVLKVIEKKLSRFKYTISFQMGTFSCGWG